MNRVTLLGYEFHFGIGFLNELLDGMGIRLDEIGLQEPTILMPKTMYYSLLYSYKRSGKEVDFDMNTIFDLIDNNGGVGGSFWSDFDKAFLDSMYKGVPEDTDKKKVVKKK